MTESTLDPEVPGWTIWISVTRRWWAFDEAVLTAAQIARGCLPLLYADDPAALASKIQKQERLREIHPARQLSRTSAAERASWIQMDSPTRRPQL